MLTAVLTTVLGALPRCGERSTAGPRGLVLRAGPAGGLGTSSIRLGRIALGDASAVRMDGLGVAVRAAPSAMLGAETRPREDADADEAGGLSPTAARYRRMMLPGARSRDVATAPICASGIGAWVGAPGSAPALASPEILARETGSGVMRACDVGVATDLRIDADARGWVSAMRRDPGSKAGRGAASVTLRVRTTSGARHAVCAGLGLGSAVPTRGNADGTARFGRS